MKRRFFHSTTAIIVLLLLLATVTVIVAQNITCPVDNSSSYFTGRTKTDVSGHQLWEYKCTTYGHRFWVVK